MSRADFPPRQDPTVKESPTGEDEALNQVVREQADYKDLVKRFDILKTPQGRKELGFDSQADFMASLKEAIGAWGRGPKKDAAELFVKDFGSRAAGAGSTDKPRSGKKTPDFRALARQDEVAERGEAPKSKKDKRGGGRSSLAEQVQGLNLQVREAAPKAVVSSETAPLSAPEVAASEVFSAAEEELPGAEVLTVEAARHVVEELREEVAETGELPTLEQFRQRLMDWFPRLAVRTGRQDLQTKEWTSNIDGNACLYFFKHILGFAKGTQAEKDYVSKNVVYVKPGKWQEGALNLDTSPFVQGGLMEMGNGFIDHHAEESPRASSAFNILYEYFKEAGILKDLGKEDAKALERLAQFVTHIDSYTLPPSVKWSDAWNSSHRTIFGLTLAYQSNVPVEALFDFFKYHDLKEAWTFAVDVSRGPHSEKFQKLSQEWLGEKRKTEAFVKEIKVRPNKMGFVAETKELGKILVQTQNTSREKKEALQFAALAHGFDGILVWEPNSSVFFLAVGPNKEISPPTMQKIGEGLLVRKSLVKKMGQDRKNTLGSLLLSLGVDKEKLPADIKRQVEEALALKVETGGGAEKSVAEEPMAEAAEKTPAEKQAGFRQFLFDTLQTNDGRLPQILFKTGKWVRYLVENWDTFLGALDDHSVAKGKLNTAGWIEAVDFIKVILDTHPEMAQEQLFIDWKQKVGLAPRAPEPSSPPMVEAPTPFVEPPVEPSPAPSPPFPWETPSWEVPTTSFPELGPVPPPPVGPPMYGEEQHRRVEQLISRLGQENAPVIDTEGVLFPETRREEESGTTEVEEVSSESVREVFDASRLQELGEGGENPETAGARMDGARQEYIEKYNAYLTAKKEASRLRWLKDKLFFRKTSRREKSTEVLKLLQDSNAARRYYLKAKKEYARSLFQFKARDLAGAGLTIEEITEELNKFNHEIFSTLIIGEEAVLQAAKAMEWPPREKGFLRKGFDWWVKQHWTVRVLLTSGVLTGALFAGGYVGAGAVGGYALSRLARSGAAALVGMNLGKAVDWLWGKTTGGYVDKELQKLAIRFRESGGYSVDVIDRIWKRQNMIYEQAKSRKKIGLAFKIMAMTAGGLGASLGLNMLFASSAEAAQQVATTAKGSASQAMTEAGTVKSGAVSEPTLRELQHKLQQIMDESDRQNKSFMEALKAKAEMNAAQARVDQLATIHKGEGVIHVFRRQLEAMPLKFGYTGNLDNAAAIHEWADKQATALSIKGGYWNPANGDENWVRWNPKGAMRFYVEGDVKHGLQVTETGTAGRHFIHHAATERVAEATPPPAPEAPLPPPPPETVPATGALRVVSEFPEKVQPYASHLQTELKIAQDLVDKYGSDSKFGPAARKVLDTLVGDAEKFIQDVDGGKLSAYDHFSSRAGTGAIRKTLIDAIENQAGGKLPAEVPITGRAADLAELLKTGGRIEIEKTWGLKFEVAGGGRIVPVIDAPRVEMDRVFETHAGMKTDGWLQQDQVEALATRNESLAAVPQTRLAQIDFLTRAWDKMQSSGQGTSEAAILVKKTIGMMMGNIAETIQKPVAEVFTQTFLDRVK